MIVPREINTDLLSAIIKAGWFDCRPVHRGAVDVANLRTYTVLVHAAETGEAGFWAEVIELPGCFASGATLDQLEKDVREAIEAYLLALAAHGEVVPEGSDTIDNKSTRRWEIPVEVA